MSCPVPIQKVLNEWQMSFVGFHEDPGTMLPREEAHFCKMLMDLLRQQNVKIPLNHLLGRFAHISRMTPAQRTSIRGTISEGRHAGWKIMQCGKYRLFLDINETERTLHFMVRQRQRAYR